MAKTASRKGKQLRGGTVVRLSESDTKAALLLRDKQNLSGMSIPDIVRIAYRRYLESVGIRVAA